MADRRPIDGRYPAVFFLREGHDAINQQFIQLALVIHIIRIQSQEQPFPQLDLHLRDNAQFQQFVAAMAQRSE